MERTESVTLTNMCMIYDNNGNVLVQEKIGQNYKGLIFPGGHVEKSEPIVDSTIREIHEETGLSISNLKICGIKDWMQENGDRYIEFLYKTNCFSGELHSSREGKVFWMPLAEIRKAEPFWHMDKMLDVFCGDAYNELFLAGVPSNRIPTLK